MVDNIVAFYQNLFDSAYVSTCTSIESEVMKLTCNCFYATKVQFFNEIYALMNQNQEKLQQGYSVVFAKRMDKSNAYASSRY